MDAKFDPVTLYDGGVRITVKARPGANRARAARWVDVGDGKGAIEITVADAPEDGKANKAILQHVAKALGVKITAVSVKTGHQARLKVIEITGEPEALRVRIEQWASLEKENA